MFLYFSSIVEREKKKQNKTKQKRKRQRETEGAVYQRTYASARSHFK